MNNSLVFGQFWVPNVQNQNSSFVLPFIEDLMLPRVIKDDRLALGPGMPLVVNSYPRSSLVFEGEMYSKALVCRTCVRSDVSSWEYRGELNAGEALFDRLESLDCLRKVLAVFLQPAVAGRFQTKLQAQTKTKMVHFWRKLLTNWQRPMATSLKLCRVAFCMTHMYKLTVLPAQFLLYSSWSLPSLSLHQPYWVPICIRFHKSRKIEKKYL